MRKLHPSSYIPHHSSFIIHHSSFIIHCSLFILTSFFFMLGCSKSTEPKTGSLSGRVILVNDTGDPSLDPVDFSGVTVALYQLAALDTTIVRINQEYPHIGVQISQETEFDHRMQNPVAVTTSNSEGSYNLDKVAMGTYNLVLLKQGWGIRYLYGVTVTEDSKSPTLLTQPVELYPEMLLSGSVMSFMEFMPYHSYLVSDDVIFVQGCIIHDNALIMVGAGVNVSISEAIEFSTANQYWRMTASDGMYEVVQKNSIAPFNKLSLDFITSPKLCKNGILSYLINGISSGQSKTTFENLIVRDADSSAMMLNSSDATVSNALIYRSAAKGITVYNKAQIEHTLFVNNHESCMLHQAEATVQDSYFYGSYLGIRSFLNPQIIRHNCFDKNDVAIAPSASSPTIEYNNFYDNKRDIELNRGGVATDPGYCNPSVSQNNFMGNKFYVHLQGINSIYADGYIPFIGVNANQFYPNNFWKGANLVNHIFDANYPNSGVAFSVNYTPRLQSAVQQSGIRF